MAFIWPEMLWLLVLVPLSVLAYWWLLRRRRRVALRYSGLSLVREALVKGPGWRRHVPPVLMLLALVALLVAIARPTASVTLPSQQRMVILAMDVSGSMRATDVEPSRMAAAQGAAREFVALQDSGTRIGVVTFAGTALLTQPPTHSKEDVLAAIDRFNFQRATAVGSGILVSLQAIFPDLEFDLRGTNPRPGTEDNRLGRSLDQRGGGGGEAARMAAERGVKVYTIGVGTENGEILVGDGWSMRVRLDEESLRAIANVTGAEYFYAGTAPDLKKIYQGLHSKLALETREIEVTALLAGVAAALMLLAAGLSVFWFHRVL
jgi:Ca-activated chloride channel homolog